MKPLYACLLWQFLLLPVFAQEPPSSPGSERAFVPLFKTPTAQFRGPLPSTEFFFRLPEHIRLQEGCELVLCYQASPLLIPEISTATFEVNGSPVTSIRLPGEGSDENGKPATRTIAVPIRTAQLNPGWNRLEVKCLMLTTQILCRDVDNPACWFLLEQGTGIRLAYSRTILFPELSRFPDSITEEQLLRQEELVDDFPEKDVRPVATILLPEKLTNTAFRGLVVGASRLGQPSYLRFNSVRVGQIGEWNRVSGDINGLLIGLREDLGKADLPVETRGALAALQPGEGLLSEIITGEPGGSQRRWILVSGTDDLGLNNAILTLGSNDALDLAFSNPWVVTEAPVISEFTDKLTRPLTAPQSFDQLHGGRLLLRGVFRSQASLKWTLPPGYETDAGSHLILEMSHAGGLGRESAVQVKINDALLPGVPLQEKEEDRSLVRLTIPPGLPGWDPDTLTVSSYLDIGATDCSHRNEERAWVSFSGESFLEVTARPLQINGLDRLGLVLLRDAFLRRAAVLLPADPSAGDLEVVRDLALHLGQSLPSMPVLWPEAALYSADAPVSADVMANRSAVLLGNSAQWQEALPPDTRLSIAAVPGKDALRLQNREIPDSQLTGSLVFAEFLPSPWSPDNCVVAIGGVHEVGGRTAARLLTTPEFQGRLAGTVAGLDGEGRIFSYDTRAVEPQSLAERVQDRVPKGMTLTETQKRLAKEERLRNYFSVRNLVIAGVVLLVVLLMIRTQMRLMALRTRRRRESSKDDSSPS